MKFPEGRKNLGFLKIFGKILKILKFLEIFGLSPIRLRGAWA
jgi:hypothetical protein